MVDKVQEKFEESETSLFHHGLMKLLVLDELQRLGRDWSSFLFVSGFELDALTPLRTPKSRKIPSPLTVKQMQPLVAKPNEPARAESSKKIMKELDKMQSLDTPSVPPAKHKSKVVKPAKQKHTVSKQGTKRMTGAK